MPDTVAPEQVLKELADLWVSLGKEGSAGVLRACTMTFIVLAEESEDPAALGETIAALMPEHPSRAVLVRFHNDPAREPAARVLAQCWMPFGQRRQICCEQIEISAPESRAADVAALLVPIAAADLPVILWCRSCRLLEMPAFTRLASVGRKLIVDSGATLPPARIEALMKAGLVVADLAWTRLTAWREQVARAFDNPALLAQLRRTTTVRVVSEAAPPPAWAWYLAAWTAAAVGKAGGSPRVAVESGEVPVGLLEFQDGGSLRFSAPAPIASNYLLLREELRITDRDPIFEKTLEFATRLALSSTRL